MRAHLLQDTTLRYFLEVAHSGSLTEASARLHVAASALSRQIAGLEAQLGTPLFERHPRGMVLTAAGEILAIHARRTVLDAERALGEIGALQGLRAGQVRLATSDAFANELVPRLCVEFQRTHTGIQFSVISLPTAQVLGAVRSGAADIGLCFSRAPHQDIEVAYRQTAPVLALVPPGHPLARARSVSLAQMARHPLALPPPETTVRQMIDIVCSRQGLQMAPVLISNHAKTVLNFVVHGGGLSVASEIAARHLVAAGAIVALPISDPGMDLRDLEVQTLAGRSLPVAVQAFLDLLKERLPERW
ncbi:LysR substrate-binding domain-containing protein [Verminephrobacter eiseniae]|uniref:LysR substrate-binding domain-containing protein n=1 Tax=Verminephrobacter eiseniae TaxID=364317 RepID=UPI00223884A1|nr:LysR substrate-binding domain-containing protein [Verminephrobacter eiseniae]MCW5232999.1 LysR family transcriptional regulator [Verminephrobacter eiseniae]MCW5295445.1 LysR family transcriptional regulator [Verminephrobacter eiseniae]MCW8185948.1 LysR family transcriptional regulator [Verminephrobacter eiseniae]MCW8224219.1 LysR family transcriptional regulator [Verminephrobacter eiseniae]MCW8233208.1 LysR family transcriptional regulator [Verminephrobacter eiseniae]